MSVIYTTQHLIECLVTETGASDPFAAIRTKAREVINRYSDAFGEPTMPLCMETLASFVGIARCDEPPAHSKDAELVPDGAGGVKYRVNPDRPETRQQFSIAHEICHTFFPDYQHKVWCRPDARYRNRENPDEYLEMLCDIGAAELLLPVPWFERDAAKTTTAAGLVTLAANYRASCEAVLRRFAELQGESAAAVYFSWKLKPKQVSLLPRADERNLFGINPIEEAKLARKLRINYSIPSLSFRASGHYLATDKSIDNVGPLYEAALHGRPSDGECQLSLGPASGTYRVLAVPVWTDEDELGPNGENGVAAIIYPLAIRTALKKKKSVPDASALFGETA